MSDSVGDSPIMCKRKRKSIKLQASDCETSQGNTNQETFGRTSESSSQRSSSASSLKSPKVRRSKRIKAKYDKLRASFSPLIKARGRMQNIVHTGRRRRIQSPDHLTASSGATSLFTLQSRGSSVSQSDPSPPRPGRFESAYAIEVHAEVHAYSGMTEDVHTATTGLYILLYFVLEKSKILLFYKCDGKVNDSSIL